tara:strand:- start:757 stop:2169 length:1413 start_codon:yes stop_codon:yes gene_type:complete
MLGFSSGLPILLVFSTLSVWLTKAGIERSTVTLFSWAGFAYAFKFLWSPLVDKVGVPFFSNMGHRRSWLLIIQLLIIFSLILTSINDPKNNIIITAICITLVAFFSATQDIIIDAYRIESVDQKLQGSLSSMYIAGYRIGMLVGGAGSLWLASYWGSESYDYNVWRKVYLTMSLLMLIGIIANLISSEPKKLRKFSKKTKSHFGFFLNIFISVLIFIFIYSNLNNPFGGKNILSLLFTLLKLVFCFVCSGLFIFLQIKLKFQDRSIIKESYFSPIKNFIKKYGKFALFILLLISLYRMADVVMGVMANIFYLEKGYSISQIATYSKFFGVFATIAGGLLGGYFAMKFGTMITLFIGALIASSSNLLFAWLATTEANIKYLISVITADNISSGFAGAAFVIYLSGLTSLKFTATQYALFSSIMLFLPKLIAGYSGSWVDIMGYQNYFIVTALLGIPVLFLIVYISKVAPIK